jgi:methylated-DNA-protein-cysteine methyltransferase-like protein
VSSSTLGIRRREDGVDTALAARILDVVSTIPAGRVATYGDVAARAGGNSARFAGWVLAQLADDSLPWHRVIPASGRPAPAIATRQLSRLAAEGVSAVDGRIDLGRYRDASDPERSAGRPAADRARQRPG